MNHKYLAGAVAIAAVAVLTTACSSLTGTDAGGDLDLKFASYNVPDAAESKATAAWADKVSEATDGQVTVEFFYQESLLSGVETLPGVADGRADMGFIADAYYPAELPLTTVVGLPFVTSNAEAQGRAFIDLYENNDALAAEWEEQGVHALLWAPVPANLVALKEPTSGIDDLDGRKIRGYGYVSQALEAAGASTVGIAQVEVYEALQRGVLDGTSGTSLDIAADRDYQEVAPHYVDFNTGNYAITAIVINRSVWESMSDDVRAAITEVSEDYLGDYLEQLGKVEDRACQELHDAGGDIKILPPEATNSWADKVGPKVKQEWVDTVEDSAGDADAEAFYDDYTDKLEKYEAESEYESGLKRCAAKH